MSGLQARRTEAETFRAAPSGRRILAADSCASSLSNPAGCFSAVWAPGGPRGVAVAMFGHTGLGMLICRIAGAGVHAYSPDSMITRGSADLHDGPRSNKPVLGTERSSSPLESDYGQAKGPCELHSLP